MSTEILAAEDGASNLGEWLLNSIAYLTEVRIIMNEDASCFHLQTESLTQSEMDMFEVEVLLEDNGSGSTH